MQLPKVKYGDVFQLPLTKGLGFIQCIKESTETECEIIRVLQGVYCENEHFDVDKIVEKKELFFLQLPIKYAVKKKLLQYVGNFNVPSSTILPRFFRTKHIVGTQFICWHIVDSKTLKIKSVKNLSDEEKKLSEWDIISLPDLAEKIETNWTPEKWF